MAPPRLHLNRVFCLEESVWDDDAGFAGRSSVLPTLELLERKQVLDAFVHRPTYGTTEFQNYLAARNSDRATRSFGTLYLTYHGTARGLTVGDSEISLPELARLVGKLRGGIVHLGSCSVLEDADAARTFLEFTGARAITGYRREVNWLDSSLLDAAWWGTWRATNVLATRCATSRTATGRSWTI